LKDSLDKHTAKMHETLSIQTKAVYAAIETQNQKMEENFSSQKEQLNADLNSFKEDNSKRFHRLESNVQNINVSFSERDRILSETNSRVLAMANERERQKRSTEEINGHIEKLFLTVKAHEQANHQLESKIVRVESASNIFELKCDKIENSLSKMSHTVNEKIDELQSNLCNEIQNRSKEFCDVNDRLERISDQVKSIRSDVEVGIYHPAENWDARNSKISDLDVEERIENFMIEYIGIDLFHAQEMFHGIWMQMIMKVLMLNNLLIVTMLIVDLLIMFVLMSV
jgi:chromosome segregation ATPase